MTKFNSLKITARFAFALIMPIGICLLSGIVNARISLTHRVRRDQCCRARVISVAFS